MELNKIYCEDCIEGMKKLPDNSVKLVVTDPPYNIDFKYDTYTDSKTNEEYMDWCKKWFTQLKRVSKVIVITTGTMNLKSWLDLEEPQKI